jgi:hypothetical protein
MKNGRMQKQIVTARMEGGREREREKRNARSVN